MVTCFSSCKEDKPLSNSHTTNPKIQKNNHVISSGAIVLREKDMLRKFQTGMSQSKSRSRIRSSSNSVATPKIKSPIELNSIEET